jgi:hypothetical protein
VSVKLPLSLALPKEAQFFVACVSGPRSVRPFLPIMLAFGQEIQRNCRENSETSKRIVPSGVLFHSQAELPRGQHSGAQSGRSGPATS